MPAKIVVVVQNEDAGLVARALTVEVRGGQSTDSTSNDDQVVGFTGAHRITFGVPGFSIPKSMGEGVSPIMVAPHAGQGWRVVVRSILWCTIC